jgi:hypothetical protein
VGGFDLRALFANVGKTVLASLLMAEVVWFVYRALGANAGFGAALRVLLGLLIGPAVYAGLMWLLGSDELQRLRTLLAARLSRAR